jgi:tetratricopeptide (TPR) repeat protein
VATSDLLTSTVDEDTLRARFDYPEAAAQHVQQLLLKLESELDPLKSASIHGEIGNFQRGLGLLDSAVEHLLAALLLVETRQEARRQEVVYSIRLAHVYHWQAEWEKARVLFDDLLTRTAAAEFLDLRDFVLQHRGKMFFDQQSYAEALRDFEDALVLRNKKGDAELIASTMQVQAATRRRMERSR